MSGPSAIDLTRYDMRRKPAHLDVDLPCEAVEVMFEATSRLVLGIEIEEGKRNLIGDKPFGEVNHEPGLSHTSFAALSKHHSLSRAAESFDTRSFFSDTFLPPNDLLRKLRPSFIRDWQRRIRTPRRRKFQAYTYKGSGRSFWTWTTKILRDGLNRSWPTAAFGAV